MLLVKANMLKFYRTPRISVATPDRFDFLRRKFSAFFNHSDISVPSGGLACVSPARGRMSDELVQGSQENLSRTEQFLLVTDGLPVAMSASAELVATSTSVGPRIRNNNDARVIVLGCGLAGLRCANLLINKHNFAKEQVVLLEASERIGGRIRINTSFVDEFSVSVSGLSCPFVPGFPLVKKYLRACL